MSAGKVAYSIFKQSLMPLKMDASVKSPKPKVGIDYKLEPIVAAVTTEKLYKGKTSVPSGVQEGLTVHEGVVSDGTKVTVEGGRTLNLGNFESARISVTLTVPCDKDTIDETYEFATSWVSKKIEEAISGIKS